MRALPRARRAFFGALLAAGLVGGGATVGACDTFDPAPAADGGAGAADTGTTVVVDGGAPDGEGPTRDGGDGGVPFKPCSNGTRVFVTSKTYPANFNAKGDAQLSADTLCTAAAAEAGLARPYKAWLATGLISVGPRATLTKASGAFVSTDCAIVFATQPSDFTMSLQAPIDRIENGMATESLGAPGDVHTVWTGAVADGTSTGANCGDWKQTGGLAPTTGDLKQTGAAWTTGGGGTCASAGRFYCFEVAP
ncbi:MAG: hypothetical protein HOO96_01675 [Polyangiaceae bacterium]|nr:hypothetical protein [Polyangiaceae bacterium]